MNFEDYGAHAVYMWLEHGERWRLARVESTAYEAIQAANALEKMGLTIAVSPYEREEY